jgi:hypothetical protein
MRYGPALLALHLSFGDEELPAQHKSAGVLLSHSKQQLSVFPGLSGGKDGQVGLFLGYLVVQAQSIAYNAFNQIHHHLMLGNELSNLLARMPCSSGCLMA